MSILTSLLVVSLTEHSIPRGMLIDEERRQRQLNKPLKTCKCGKGFNHRGYMCKECFEENKK